MAPLGLLWVGGLANVAQAAPPIPPGGEVVTYVLGGRLELGSDEPLSLAEFSLRAAVYEPLYRFNSEGQVEPVLAAGPPIIEGLTTTIPIKSGVVLHDGRDLEPALVAEALAAELNRGLWFAQGVVAHPKDRAIVLTTLAPFEGIDRALASPSLLLHFDRGPGRIGSGPFQVGSAPNGVWRLDPFLAHRDGRPFLDALTWRRLASRAGVVSLLRRGEATVLFGASPKGSAVAAPLEVLVLDAGARPLRGLDQAAHHDLLSGLLDRARWVDRFFGEGTKATSRLDGVAEDRPPETSPPIPPGAQLTLRVPKDAPVPLRFLERLQLDLLRRGITVTLQREDGPPGGLLLDWEPCWAGPEADPIDRLSSLLSVSRRHGREPPFTKEVLTNFLGATKNQQQILLESMERDLRRNTGLIPIAVRRAAVGIRADLLGVESGSQASLHFADAHFLESP
ncbi:MAG: hypothetical protein IPG45_06495 [Deltaproteobacteria bacterium]|nr:hypothetical protein [Deltaproteobacteria bacterium]